MDEKAKTAVEDAFVQKANELNEAATAWAQEVIDAVGQLLADVGLAERIEAEPHHKRNRRRRKRRR